jgi:hypothetical protein
MTSSHDFLKAKERTAKHAKSAKKSCASARKGATLEERGQASAKIFSPGVLRK